MNKGNQQISGRTDAQNGASDTGSTASSGKRKFLRLAWALALCMSIAGWATVVLFLDKTTWIDTDGFLHEPLFGLIPINYFFLFVAIVLALLDMALTLRNHH
jgi:hypothetical protein